jgi:hypothetical protein
MIEPPISPATELTAAAIKGLVSGIPGAGGVLSEVGDLLLNPLKRRNERWMIEVSTAINTIERRFNRLPSALASDEQFTTFLYQATLTALKTHQAVKLQALRNSVVNSAKQVDSEADIGLQYLRYIDELSSSHLVLLSELETNAARYAEFATLEEVHVSLMNDAVVGIDRSMLRAFLQDLQSRLLIHFSDLDELPEFASKKSAMLLEGSTVRPISITPHGASFLSFIRP